MAAAATTEEEAYRATASSPLGVDLKTNRWDHIVMLISELSLDLRLMPLRAFVLRNRRFARHQTIVTWAGMFCQNGLEEEPSAVTLSGHDATSVTPPRLPVAFHGRSQRTVAITRAAPPRPPASGDHAMDRAWWTTHCLPAGRC